MKIKLTWAEFVDAALIELRRRHPIDSMPEFFQHNSYEPDGQCYNFPPDYVEISCAGEVKP